MSAETAKPVAENAAQQDVDPYSLKVKSEYLATERPACLPKLPEVVEHAHPEDFSRKGRRKKGKRPRDVRVDKKFCVDMLRGNKCKFGDECKHSHDIKELLATRPPDLKDIPGGCPHYRIYGVCMYGAACRLASDHVNMATGENLRREPEEPPVAIMNVLTREVQTMLRKKKYPFVCQRSDRKKSVSKKEEDKETTTKEEVKEGTKNEDDSTPDMSPLPSKTKKPVDFSNKIYVAPLTTVGNLPFRRIVKSYGADITCGEMAMCSNLVVGQASEWALLKRHPSEDIFGVQLAAGFPDLFTRACELIEKETEVDFVDLNLGCPLDIVNSKGCGAALMKRDQRLKNSLLGITKTLSCPVTIKMRTGWDVTQPFAHELVPKIQSWNIPGIAAVMVHGRSRLQRYQKEADWNYVRDNVGRSQSVDFPRIPIIGNGDIMSYTDYENKVLTDDSPLSSCAMLGRGALIKPWLPTEIKEKRHWDISASERLDMLKDFVKFGLENWGSDQMGVNNTRRFLLEWQSFLCRYVPVGLLEVVPQTMNLRPPLHIYGRNDLETLMMSSESLDWIRITEMLLGPTPDGFRFEPKHKARSYRTS